MLTVACPNNTSPLLCLPLIHISLNLIPGIILFELCILYLVFDVKYFLIVPVLEIYLLMENA